MKRSGLNLAEVAKAKKILADGEMSLSEFKELFTLQDEPAKAWYKELSPKPKAKIKPIVKEEKE